MSETTLPPPVQTDGADPGADPAARAAVQEVVRGLAKALRTHLLYEGASPALDRFVEWLRERMGALWERLPHLTVQVEEREILWEGAPVFVAEERENLAFLLYKDGVRELSFAPGFEDGDLGAFLDVLAHIQRVRSDEEDLLTLLWERDWRGLRYRYVEVLTESATLPEESGAAPQRVPAPAQEPEPPPSAGITTEDFAESLYFLDQGELRRLEAELRREMHRDLWTDVLNGLFDRLEDGGGERQERIIGILADLLPTLLGAGRLELAARLLGELVRIATGGQKLSAGVMRALRGLFEQLGRPETIAELVRSVEETGDALHTEHLGALLAFFPPASLRPLLRAGETSGAARQALLQAAERLAAANPAALRALAGDEDAAVAAGAVRLIGRLKVADAAPDLGGVLARPEPALRLAAIEALQELRSPVASGALQRAIDDDDRDVRVAAVRALAALRYTPARAALEAALDGKRLREADLTERIAFFEAFGALAGADGVALLDRILNGKTWLGRRESGEMRACAARGLGRIHHPSAEKALNASLQDPEPVVKAAVTQALRTVRGTA
ncbi:MAG TPA: HEAT repeat domain-containing protein [Longimicrobium sp.]|nr:HEAT repeat domain-containing protein [Longimicrobium sp.]